VDSPKPEYQQQHLILGLVLLFLLGMVIYSNVLYAPFIYDDRSVITENEHIRDLSKTISLLSQSRSIGNLTFALNYAFGGLQVIGYHLFNNLVHAVNAILVYFFVHLLVTISGRTKSEFSAEYISFSVAFFFVAHPLQTQAVTYISQRFTSLATMFYLISIICYIKARLSLPDKEKTEIAKSFSKKTLLLYIVSLFSAVLAMKTKEIAITIPFSIILCEIIFFQNKGDLKTRLIFLSPFILSLIIIPISFLFRVHSSTLVASQIDAMTRDTTEITRLDYAITQLRVIVTYLRLLILPYNQNFDYAYEIYKTFFTPEILLSLILLVGLIFTAFFACRRAKLISFGIAWFFLTLSVESSFIPIRDVINEHRLYLPSIGFFLASVSAVDQVVSARGRKIVITAILVLLCAIATYNRNKIWKDPELLWEDVLIKAPNNARANNNLGTLLKEKGEYDKAVMLFEKSLQSNRNYTAVYYNLGDIEYRRGNYEKALNYLSTALSGKRDRQLTIDILNKLGRTYGAMGQTEKAVEMYKKGLELSPASIVLLNNLGVQYLKGKQIDEAIETYERAIKIKEEDYLFLNLAVAYSQKGNYQKSDLLKQKAFELQQGK
jgi:protein O-mannosyl-transferase